MELKNISANFLGDSITEGHGTTDPSTKVYHQLIAKKYGMKIARNYGIGGTRLAKSSVPSANPQFDLDFSGRFSEMDDDAQLIVVFGGTNDYGHGSSPFGTMADRTPDTFYGACHYIMSGLLKKYPSSKIVIMTPIHRCGEDAPGPNTEKKLIDYVNAIREVAEYYALPLIDLWANSGIQPNVEVIKNAYCPDGLHPNDAGHERMAEYIGNRLAEL